MSVQTDSKNNQTYNLNFYVNLAQTTTINRRSQILFFVTRAPLLTLFAWSSHPFPADIFVVALISSYQRGVVARNKLRDMI